MGVALHFFQSLGFVGEGLFEQASWFKDEWTDLAYYGIRADDWRAAQEP